MPKLETPSDQQYQHQLPKVSFRVITDDKTLLQPAGVHSVRQRLLAGLILTARSKAVHMAVRHRTIRAGPG